MGESKKERDAPCGVETQVMRLARGCATAVELRGIIYEVESHRLTHPVSMAAPSALTNVGTRKCSLLCALALCTLAVASRTVEHTSLPTQDRDLREGQQDLVRRS